MFCKIFVTIFTNIYKSSINNIVRCHSTFSLEYAFLKYLGYVDYILIIF